MECIITLGPVHRGGCAADADVSSITPKGSDCPLRPCAEDWPDGDDVLQSRRSQDASHIWGSHDRWDDGYGGQRKCVLGWNEYGEWDGYGGDAAPGSPRDGS